MSREHIALGPPRKSHLSAGPLLPFSLDIMVFRLIRTLVTAVLLTPCSCALVADDDERSELPDVSEVSEALTDSTTWRQAAYGPSHARASVHEAWIGAENVAQLGQVWTGSTSSESHLSAPVVADGRVVVGTRAGDVRAFDAATGQRLWSTPVFGSVNASVAVAYGRVYAGSNDKKLYVLSASTGRVIFTAAHPAQISSAAPLLWNGRVYLRCDNGRIYVYDAKATGAVAPAWTVLPPGGATADPAIANGRLYVASADQKVHAYDADGCGAATCPALWDSAAVGYVSPDQAPSVASGRIVVAAGAGVHALDSTTGALLWSTSAPARSGVAIANGAVFVAVSEGLQVGQLWALSLANGTLRWHAPLSLRFFPQSPPTVANRVVYVGSHDADLAASAMDAFDTSCGNAGALCSSSWSVALPTTTGVSAPIVVDGRLIVNAGKSVRAFAVP
jgi:outer membrane protein assembly factor BamB